jgi:hypothetical protein
VLVCPSCATGHEDGERFCENCGVPLVQAEPEPLPGGDRRERARKIRPQYAEGPLVKVVGARNQAEAELLQGMLLEEGVPSLMRRSGGFDVPDFLASGPRDILVPASGAGAARDILLQADLGAALPGRVGDAPLRVLAGVLLAVAVVALIVWVGAALLG